MIRKFFRRQAVILLAFVGAVWLGACSQPYRHAGTVDAAKLRGIEERMTLGLVTRDFDNEHNSFRPAGVDHGLVVMQMIKNSPAHKAGLRSNDIIVSVNGIELDTANNMKTLVGEIRNESEVVSLKTFRLGNFLTFTLPKARWGDLIVDGKYDYVATIVESPAKQAPEKPAYGEIDTRLARETIDTLLNGPEAAWQQAVESITAHPERYAPPVFYALSLRLFSEGEKDRGAFWFYAGQLRARFDANRCADATARQAVDVLNQRFGTPVNRYMFQDLPKLEQLIDQVVAWDRKTPHNYDHRWINLHGMNAVKASLDGSNLSSTAQAFSLPREDWGQIEEKTRADYLSAFHQALQGMKN